MSKSELNRVLFPEIVRDLTSYLSAGGVRGWSTAEAWSSDDLIALVEAAGIRGRGGAGFPTSRKWQTTREHAAAATRAPTVVVNAAEGEPGSFKDRLLMRRNPFKVLEGALIAARAVDAGRVIVATKDKYKHEVGRLGLAIEQIRASSAFDNAPEIELVTGPDRYLLGEETALLEAIAGRQPFPRVSPPWRHGTDRDADDRATADVQMATEGASTVVPPTLVNNVETLCHVADVARFGADWFREHGTDESPGTMLCTITGDVSPHCVVEVPVGSSINEILAACESEATEQILGVLPGVTLPLITPERLDSPTGYGSSDGAVNIGSGALRVFNASANPVAIVAGVERFLSVESCGQCTPCKSDGLHLRGLLEDLVGESTGEHVLDQILARSESVVDGARCALAGQQADIVGALFEDFSEAVMAHSAGTTQMRRPVEILPLDSIEDGEAVYDEGHLAVNPDWTRGSQWSGAYPAQADAGPEPLS